MTAEQATPIGPASRAESRVGLIAVALLALLIVGGLTARVVGLGVRPLWDDEAWTYFIAGRGVARLFQHLPLDNHPPLFYLAEGMLLRWFGPSEAALRTVPLLAGLLTVATIGPIASRLWGRGAGLLAAALAASAPLLVYYSQEARFYSVLGLETLVGGWLLWQHAERLTWRSGAVAVVVGMLAAYTHYFGAFLIAFGLVAALWRTRRLSIAALAPATIIFAGTLPLVPLILAQKANYAAVKFTGGAYGETVSLGQSLGRALVVLGNGGYPEGLVRFAGYGGFLLLTAVIMWRAARTTEGRRALAFPVLLTGVLVTLWQIGGQLHLWPLRDNYVASFAPPIYLLLAGAAAPHGLPRDRRVGAAAAAGVLAIMLTGTLTLVRGGGRRHADYRAAGRRVDELQPDGLLLARNWGDLSCLAFYQRVSVPTAVFGVDPGQPLTFEARVLERPLVNADSLLGSANRVCLMGKSSGKDGFAAFSAALTLRGYQQVEEQPFHEIRLTVWEKSTHPTRQQSPTSR